MSTPPNDNDAGARGRAILDLMRWVRSNETVRALEAMQLLELSDADIELLFRNTKKAKVVHVPWADAERGGVVQVPWLGTVR